MTDTPGALVTGSGRCGTGYLARVLQEGGINAAHEGWWTLHQDPVPNLAVDVSWLGCFDEGYGGPVYTLVRSPWECIPSIYNREFVNPRYHLLRRVTVPLVGDPVLDAALIWVGYTAHALKRSDNQFWRVEFLDADELHRAFGGDRDRLARALDAVPTDTNSEPHRGPYEWPDNWVWDEVCDLAEALGYDEGMP